ncbi:MAG: hypothetical protein OYK82_04340 [Gammaproteobacteria bacterium]|nr:hypothetical protein [Gammaproteobacteria bacterium]
MPPLSRAAALCAAVAALTLTAGCASGPGTSLQQSPSPGDAAENSAAAAPDQLGVLVMAHGGRAEWNGHVHASVSELGERIPLAVAFGMADPHTLQTALDELGERGVGTIAVVRLFLSGDSFLHQTEFLFGLRPDPPARAMMGHRMVAGSDLPLLETEARILMDLAGMAGSEQVNGIMLARAGGSSPDAETTGVVLIAHGMGAEEEDRRLLSAMERSAAELRTAGHGEVRIATLREDWAEARAAAEEEIWATVSRMGGEWDQVVVIPYRVFGFGPYAEVLEGLDYVGTEGLLPHSLVGEWVAARSSAVFCAAGLVPPLGPCQAAPVPASR